MKYNTKTEWTPGERYRAGAYVAVNTEYGVWNIYRWTPEEKTFKWVSTTRAKAAKIARELNQAEVDAKAALAKMKSISN